MIVKTIRSPVGARAPQIESLGDRKHVVRSVHSRIHLRLREADIDADLAERGC